MNEHPTENAPRASATRRFRVRVGHASITVAGRDRQDAIQQARRKLGTELPRLWDVIYRLDEGGFHVDELH